jgi:FMN-dependent NADH-azoreductase
MEGTKMKILVINSSNAGEASASRKVTQAVVDRLRAKNANAEVKHYDLAASPLPHIDPAYAQALFTSMSAPEKLTENGKALLAKSDTAVQDLKWADHIVIASPFYNFSIPSTLKSWIDYICRPGMTFRYGEKGPEGLITGKKVHLVISYGGIYSDDPVKKALDFAQPYLKTTLGFLGMTDITSHLVEGTSMPGMRDKAIETAIASIKV